MVFKYLLFKPKYSLLLNRNFVKNGPILNYQRMQIINRNYSLHNTSTTEVSSTKEEIMQFKSVLPQVITSLTNEERFKGVLPMRDVFREMLTYNLSIEKSVGGLHTFSTYKTLEKKEKLTDENIKLAAVLGWCVDMVTSFVNVLDDVMNNENYREGKPCWHKHNNNGLNSINHMFMVENSIYFVLQEYFGTSPLYTPIVEQFHEMIFNTIAGQTLEQNFIENGKPNWELYTPDKLNQTTHHRTSYGIFYSPVILASHLADKFSQQLETHAQYISAKLGSLYQAHNDFWSCFGGSSKQRKSDIAKGKCTWLVVQALQKGTTTQKTIIKEFYGKSGVDAEQAIRNLYEEMELPADYISYEKTTLNEIMKHLTELPEEVDSAAFSKLWKLAH